MKYTPFTPQTRGKYALSNFFQHNYFYLYPYARIALFELLKKLKIKSIYLPSLICRDILAPLNLLNIRYFFYEIDQNFNPINLCKHCDAVLFVNYFGFSADITPFEEYKKRYNAILIEDNAHGFLSKDHQGQWLGTRGDFGVFSLRKTLALYNGGLLSINNEKFYNLNLASYPCLLPQNPTPSLTKEKLKALSPLLAYQSMRFRQLIRYIKTGNSLPQERQDSEIALPEDQYVTSQLFQDMLQFDIQAEITRRVAMYKRIDKIAQDFNISPLQKLYQGCSPFVLPFIAEGNYKKFEKHLSGLMFYTLPWPSLPKESFSKASWYQKIKVVSFLW